jgi:hypothetical protein
VAFNSTDCWVGEVYDQKILLRCGECRKSVYPFDCSIFFLISLILAVARLNRMNALRFLRSFDRCDVGFGSQATRVFWILG